MKRKTVDLTSVGHICCLLFGLPPVIPLPLIFLQIQSLRLENNAKPCPRPCLPLPHSELPELCPHSTGHPTCGCCLLPRPAPAQGTTDLLHAKSEGLFPVTSYGIFLQTWTSTMPSFSIPSSLLVSLGHGLSRFPPRLRPLLSLPFTGVFSSTPFSSRSSPGPCSGQFSSHRIPLS